ncbi:DUF6890 family protein [Enterobacter ludwigii]
MMTLRRHYLPFEQDSDESYSRAMWLDNHYWENFRKSAASGVVLAFEGE